MPRVAVVRPKHVMRRPDRPDPRAGGIRADRGGDRRATPSRSPGRIRPRSRSSTSAWSRISRGSPCPGSPWDGAGPRTRRSSPPAHAASSRSRSRPRTCSAPSRGRSTCTRRRSGRPDAGSAPRPGRGRRRSPVRRSAARAPRARAADGGRAIHGETPVARPLLNARACSCACARRPCSASRPSRWTSRWTRRTGMPHYLHRRAARQRRAGGEGPRRRRDPEPRGQDPLEADHDQPRARRPAQGRHRASTCPSRWRSSPRWASFGPSRSRGSTSSASSRSRAR